MPLRGSVLKKTEFSESYRSTTFSEKSYLFDSPISSATGRPSRFHLVELLVEGQLTHGEEFRVTWWDELQDVGPVGKCNLNML